MSTIAPSRGLEKNKEWGYSSTHMKNTLTSIVVLALVAVGAYYLFSGSGPKQVYASDTTLPKNTVITGRQEVTLKSGATLTVKGNLEINGTLTCDGGPLSLVVEGEISANGTISCEGGGGINIVAQNKITFGKDVKVVSDGSVQIVDESAKLASSEAAIEALYRETGENSGEGTRIGPMIEGGKVGSGVSVIAPKSSDSTAFSFFGLVHVAEAQSENATDKNGNTLPGVVVSGTWTIGDGAAPPSGVDVNTPGKKVKKIILNFDFGVGGKVTLKDFHLVGPKGRAGEDDEGKSCDAKGEDGENAFRFRVQAQDITLDNFRLELGDGGQGGFAETQKECDPGIARGGKGGEAGNFKMTAIGTIQINAFHIVPGIGGAGGSAIANGKNGENGCPGKKGADATATGGEGGKNKKELAVAGGVSGIGNVTIDNVLGGFGGYATANPGKGGDGTACKCGGGAGGKGTATAGKGGDASLFGIAGTSEGGDGGDASSHGGLGGNGGSCGVNVPKGGAGGKGGDAKSTFGKGGMSTTLGTDGTVKDETGGNGGNGGDGCGEGKGGKGGIGNPPGKNGADGKRICMEEKPKTIIDTGGTGAGVESSGTGTVGGGTSEQQKQPKKYVQAIKYQNKYLPVSELIIENEVGCGADHWHAARGVAIATDGTKVPDPGPQCGFGKVRDLPTMQVEVP